MVGFLLDAPPRIRFHTYIIFAPLKLNAIVEQNDDILKQNDFTVEQNHGIL